MKAGAAYANGASLSVAGVWAAPVDTSETTSASETIPHVTNGDRAVFISLLLRWSKGERADVRDWRDLHVVAGRHADRRRALRRAAPGRPTSARGPDRMSVTRGWSRQSRA